MGLIVQKVQCWPHPENVPAGKWGGGGVGRETLQGCPLHETASVSGSPQPGSACSGQQWLPKRQGGSAACKRCSWLLGGDPLGIWCLGGGSAPCCARVLCLVVTATSFEDSADLVKAAPLLLVSPHRAKKKVMAPPKVKGKVSKSFDLVACAPPVPGGVECEEDEVVCMAIAAFPAVPIDAGPALDLRSRAGCRGSATEPCPRALAG